MAVPSSTTASPLDGEKPVNPSGGLPRRATRSGPPASHRSPKSSNSSEAKPATFRSRCRSRPPAQHRYRPQRDRGGLLRQHLGTLNLALRIRNEAVTTAGQSGRAISNRSVVRSYMPPASRPTISSLPVSTFPSVVTSSRTWIETASPRTTEFDPTSMTSCSSHSNAAATLRRAGVRRVLTVLARGPRGRTRFRTAAVRRWSGSSPRRTRG